MTPVVPPDGYIELQCTTNFSFLRGASHPDELVLQASTLGQSAIGIADRNSLAGVVRAHVAARGVGNGKSFRVLIGTRLDLRPRPDTPEQQSAWEAQGEPLPIHDSLLVYPIDRHAYGALTELITLGRRRAPKGACYLSREDLEASAPEGFLMIQLAPDHFNPHRPDIEFTLRLTDLAQRFPGQVYLAAHDHLDGLGPRRINALAQIAATAEVPLIACNDSHYHVPGRKRLQDIVTCVRHGVTIDDAGFRLFSNAERHLKSAARMRHLFRRHPQAISETKRFADRITFSLDDLRYEYPRETTHNGFEPQEELERLTWAGAKQRFGFTPAARVTATIQRELKLIAELDYAPYFLTVHDLVRFARSQGILCQGRGSAANSTVCYCLGVTAVDPIELDLLFERFVSAARNEPPDIDIDFEHERREEVIQYIYKKYGRHRAGLAATVVTYRTRGAVRDVGKAMGLSDDSILALGQNISAWNRDGFSEDRVTELGFDPHEPRLALTLELCQEILGFPRHLSQHVGGFVLTDKPLTQIVPVENAAMADRTIVQWDKDDLEALHILKVDVLALGMLTCIRKAFDLLRQTDGKIMELHSVPAEDKDVYEMISRADTVGVFQIESRAQMSMLPRLQPRTYYDLVIEVAIVRPGPIQGDMVHPYLRRRQKKEQVEYPSPELEAVLGKTLGVPLFQEQAMKIAIVAADFTPEEADQLRRAMATFRKNGLIHNFGEKLKSGMAKNGYDPEFADKVFNQIKGFGTYGFPESHAASFALLVYVSCWLKHHHPHLFACALLNSQPMGFYSPAQIIRDARDHGVEVRAVDINYSDWDNRMEITSSRYGQAIRLGLRQVKGLSEQAARALMALRDNGFRDIPSLWRRVQSSAGHRKAVTVGSMEALARADAFASLELTRREAFWAIKALPPDPLPLFAATGDLDAELVEEVPESLPKMSLGEEVADDFRALRLSLKAHPMAILRPRLQLEHIGQCQVISTVGNNSRVTVAGLVLVRQRPGSASGVVFITLEDETGIANLVIWPKVFEKYRREILGSSLIKVKGRVQKEGKDPYCVMHLVVEELEDYTHWLADLAPDSDNGDSPVSIDGRYIDVANADEMKRPPTNPLADPYGAENQTKRVPNRLDDPREAAQARAQRQAGSIAAVSGGDRQKLKREFARQSTRQKLRLKSRDFH